jgi:ribosomal protein S18 acetylase RimI-like enzyme
MHSEAEVRRPNACCSPASPRQTSIGDEVRRSRKVGGFTVRKATLHDATSIQHCLTAAFAAFEDVYTPEAFADTVPSAAGLQQRVATMCLLVAECDDHVIGTIACKKLNSDEGHLRGMAVLPEWQGSPVAAALLAAAEAEMRQQGCTRLTLGTTEGLQRAIRFYQKHGFRHCGRVADFFGMRLHEYVKEL